MSVPLFTPLQIRDVVLPNRVAVSPMCQYSAADGVPDDWHLVHLGSRAVGGAGLVIAEATAVEERGRISPGDVGIWNDRQAEAWARIARFLKDNGARAGVQLAHAGRKASTDVPWSNGGAALTAEQGGWETVAPSAVPFRPGEPPPHELAESEIGEVVQSFAEAARRSLEAGFEVIEIHGAHGYLLNEFCSPLSNLRTDAYGGSFENRTRIVRDIVNGIRRVWPDRLPVFLRLSATDWVDGGWTIEDTIALARTVAALGVDLIDCSSGGNVPGARIPVGPGYQVPLAQQVRAAAGVRTGAVGMITDPEQANEVVASGKSDIVLLAREFLRDPYWPLRAARRLGAAAVVPKQYTRAF